MTWTCAACSYIDNNDARSRCEVCDASKPARPVGAAAAAPQQAGPDWTCPSCTLVNRGKDALCTACGEKRPAAFAAARAAPAARPLPGAAAVPAPAPRATPSPAPVTRPSPSPSPSLAASSARASPTTVPPAAQQARAASPAQPSEGDVAFLSQMGFSREKSVAALQASKNNRDAALDFLLAQTASPPPPKAGGGAAAAASSAKPAAASSSSSSSSVAKPPLAAASSMPAAPAVAPLKKLTPAEQAAFDQREAKRLALLKQLDEEAAAKQAAAKAKQAATAAAHGPPAAAASHAAPKKQSSASASAAPVSASAIPAAVPAPAALTPAEVKLARIQAERAAEAAKAKTAALRISHRLAAEAKLRSLPDVLATLRGNYDSARFISIITMLRKIIDKIVEDKGQTERFRRIPLDNPKLELVLVRPIGPIWILKQVGFEESVVGGAGGSDGVAPMDTSDSEAPSSSSSSGTEGQRVLLLPANKVNLAALSSLSATLAQQLQAQSSPLPALFREAASSGRYSGEQLYWLAVEMQRIIHNIVVSVDEVDQIRDGETQDDANSMSDASGSASSSSAASRRSRRDTVNKNFRTLDKGSAGYQRRVKPIIESRRMLAALGFEKDEHDLTGQYLVVPHTKVTEPQDVERYNIMLREIHAIVAELSRETPIARGLAELCRGHARKPVSKLVDLILSALRTVVADPHEQKYHKIVLSKLQAKVGSKPSEQIKGLEQFVRLFGFEPAAAVAAADGGDAAGDESAGRVALPYPGFDIDELQMRADELERNWNALCAQADAESGGKAQCFSFA